ncbi:DMT family transporter [Candidatus Woesearchaeota archaeon]|nr:DMT family transporter [Candidatus Woesearchaeota archaeon]
MQIGIIFGIVSLLGWGFLDYLVAVAVRKHDRINLFFWHTIVVVVLLSIISVVTVQDMILSWKILALTIIMGVLGTVGTLGYYRAFQEGKLTLMSALVNAWPLLTIILAILFLGDHITRFQGYLIIALIVGSVLTSIEFHRFKYKGLTAGLKHVIIPFFAWAFYFMVFDIFTAQIGWMLAILYTHIFILISTMIYGRLTKMDFRFHKSTTRYVLSIAVLEVVAFICYGLGITYGFTALIAPIIAAVPIVTAILARLLLKERIYLNQKAGIIIVVACLILLAL